MKRKLSCQLFRLLGLVILFSLGLPQAWAGPAATTTTLTMASGGNVVASGGSAVAGSVVTLMAAVLSGSTKVTSGQVTFCDASAASCTDIHLLGTAQLTSTGTAIFSFHPSIGSHSFKAVFAGTPNGTAAYAASASGTVTLTVSTGLYPSFAVLTYTGVAPSAYDLTTIVGGNASTAPTGKVSYLDVNNSAVLGTASLSALPPGPTFLNVSWAPFNWFVLGGQDLALPIAVGDFNGDGIPDIAGAGGAGSDTVAVWDAAAGAALGDGKGNFYPAVTTDLGSSFETFYVAVGDFNGDGKLDLAVGGYIGPTYSITILLGNGDGTFTTKGSVATGGAFQVFAVGDFNGDGIPDLAVANTTANTVTILLGNGDGTFTASTAAASPTGTNPVAIAVGDFNGDGIPDLAIGNDPPGGGAGSLTILLGNGNGTFTAAASPATTSGVNSIAIADFNGDGFADIVVADGLTITMLTGKGDGTFTTSTIEPIGARSLSTTIVGDFNGDGKADVAINGWPFLLLGNGDGTFSQLPFEVVLPTSVGSVSYPIAVGADFNGDGTTDFAAPDGTGDETQAVAAILLAANQWATATADGVTLPLGSGSQEVDASYPGDSNYGPTTSEIADLIAPSLAAANVSLTASPNPASFGASVTLTATVSGSAGTPTGTVGFYDDNSLLGSAALNGSGVATYSTSALPLGANSLTATYGGNSIYQVTNSAPVNLTVTTALLTPTVTVTPSAKSITPAQSLTVPVAVNGTTVGATPSGTVTLASGSYTAQQPLASGAASFTIAAGALNSGADTLTATYSGDGNYAIAMATSTVTVAPVGMAIPAPAPVSPGGSATATATITASDSYTGTVNLICSLTSSPTGAQSLPTCSLNPTSVTLKAGASGTSALTVATTAASTSALLDRSHKSLWGLGGGGAVLAAVLMCGIPSKRRRWMRMLVLLWIAAAALAIGCGGGSTTTTGTSTPATTAGSYIFTVTGTDSANASITTSTTVTVTVQ